ncbi:hypothetical protein AgCh_031905 [Apium graveolens]
MFKADPLMLVQESLARVNKIRKEFLICIELSTVNGEYQTSVRNTKAATLGEVKRLTEKELQEKKSNVLYFRCDIKWAIGHRRNERELSVMLIDKDDENVTEYAGTKALQSLIIESPIEKCSQLLLQDRTTKNTGNAKDNAYKDFSVFVSKLT